MGVRIVLLTGEIYGIISWRRLWERLNLVASRTQELHGTHTLDGHHQQRSRRRVVEIHRIRKTGLDPHGYGGAPHETKSLFGEATASNGRRTQRPGGKPGGQLRTGGGPEMPKGSNEPSRPELRNLSMPSLMDIAPPPIFVEIQAMKE